jgi:two-component system, NarL family, response regulator YdfI
MIRVLIVATSAITQSGIENVLRNGGSLQIVGAISGYGSLAESVEELQPDVVIAEISGQQRALPEELARLAEESPLGIVLLVDESSAERDAEALRAGVRAIVPRSVSRSAIVAAAEAVGSGFAVVPHEELENLLRETAIPRRTGTPPLVEALTAREVEVLGMMVEGWGNKEISTRLGISEHTVKFHVASIMGKLNATSRTEAVTLGIRHGLVML